MAYIDPGIIGVLYQAGYALVFGILAAFVFRPWQYIKGLFRRDRDSASTSAEQPPEPADGDKSSR